MKLYKAQAISLKWTAILIAISILFKTGILSYIFYSFFPKLTPVVTLSDGKVQGKVAYTQKGTEYWEFLSIPYAEPPLGKLKFKPPVPVKPWEGIKKTIDTIPLCTQSEVTAKLRLFGQEDCLYLNVFTPPFLSGDRHPVVVTIHGGGFILGGAQHYRPGRFMNNQDVVMVIPNYRLGAQGFLNFAENSTDQEYLEKENHPQLPRGNMGLKDQRLVLQWVQKNIANFGGDPTRVTLYGQSAGGVSANILMLSNTTNKLFDRVIAHSGVALSGWSFSKYPKKLANNLVNKLGCSMENTTRLMDCLISADPHELASYSISPISPTVDRDMFVPSEETVITADTILSEHPYELMQKGVVPDIPLMLGVNSGEGALRLGRFERWPEYIQIIDENWENSINDLVFVSDLPATAAQEVRRFYFPPGNSSFTDNPQFFKDGLVKLVSDTAVFESVHSVAKMHSKKNDSGATYMILYDYLPSRLPGYLSFSKAWDPEEWLLTEIILMGWNIVEEWVNEHIFGILGGHRYGVMHSEEMIMFWELWPILELTGLVHSKEDAIFSQALINVTIDFVKGKDEISFRGVLWPTINAANQANQSFPYMLLNRTGFGEIISEPFTDRMRFWQSLGIRNYT